MSHLDILHKLLVASEQTKPDDTDIISLTIGTTTHMVSLVQPGIKNTATMVIKPDVLILITDYNDPSNTSIFTIAGLKTLSLLIRKPEIIEMSDLESLGTIPDLPHELALGQIYRSMSYVQ